MSKRAPPTVRPVKPEDYDQWKPLWDEYNAFYERTGPTALPDERSETGTDPDAGARPERDDILTREGADAPDAADIEDPDNQL